MYGEVPVPVDEAGPLHPISPYGAGKLAVDHFVSYYARHTDMSAVALRFFNVYGPHQHPRSPYSGVISVFARAAIVGEPLTVTGDGEQTRDFVYVEDVVNAIMAALTAPAARGEAINIGTGKSITVNALAGEVVALSDSTSEVRHGPPRTGDIKHSVAKVDKAESLLGFKATTPLRDGLSRTIGWMRADLGGA